MQPETLVTEQGVTSFPQPRDLATARVLAQARDHLAANVMWAYLIEMARAGVPVTLSVLREVAEAVRAGDLPDKGLQHVREPLSLMHEAYLTTS